MIFLVKLIGILIVVLGIVRVVSPGTAKQMVAFLKEGKRIYGAGSLRLLFGLIFLLAASGCRIPGSILFFGMVFLLNGVLIFFLGLERIHKVLEWHMKKSKTILRFYAIITIVVGGLILYSI